MRFKGKVKGNDEVHLRTGHEGPEGDYCTCTLSLTSALYVRWVVSATYRPLYLQERFGTRYIGNWVDPKASLDGCGKFRLHRNSIPGPSSQMQSQGFDRDYELEYPRPGSIFRHP